MGEPIGAVRRGLAVSSAAALNLWALLVLQATAGFSRADDSDSLIGTPQEVAVWFGLALLGVLVAAWAAYEASRLVSRRTCPWRYWLALAVAAGTYGAWYAAWPSG